jgi:hypothetical protein
LSKHRHEGRERKGKLLTYAKRLQINPSGWSATANRVLANPCAHDCRCYAECPSRSSPVATLGQSRHVLASVALGARCRPLGRLCALHQASPAEETRQGPRPVKQRSAQPTAARRNRQWSDLSEQRPAIPGSRFSNASESMYRSVGAVMGRPWASAGSPRARPSVP